MEESFQTKLAEAFAMYDVYMNQAQDINKKKRLKISMLNGYRLNRAVLRRPFQVSIKTVNHTLKKV